VCIGNYLGEDILRTRAAPCLRIFFLFSTISPSLLFLAFTLPRSLCVRFFLFRAFGLLLLRRAFTHICGRDLPKSRLA